MLLFICNDKKIELLYHPKFLLSNINKNIIKMILLTFYNCIYVHPRVPEIAAESLHSPASEYFRIHLLSEVLYVQNKQLETSSQAWPQSCQSSTLCNASMSEPAKSTSVSGQLCCAHCTHHMIEKVDNKKKIIFMLLIDQRIVNIRVNALLSKCCIKLVHMWFIFPFYTIEACNLFILLPEIARHVCLIFVILVYS